MTTTALHYRDGAWVPGPDLVEEACATQTVEEDFVEEELAKLRRAPHP